jgi:hypothetical protein
MTQQNKHGADDHHLPKPERRNAKFEQEVAESRDHDKQTGKGGGQTKPSKTSGGTPKKS